MKSFDEQYKNLIKDIMENGVEELNERTGSMCKVIPGMLLKVNLKEEFPLLSLRPIPIKMFVSETIFYLMGTKDPKWLQKYTHIWDKFLDKNNEITTCYGYRYRHAFGRDQIDELITLLKKDTSSRQTVISIWDPRIDGLCGPSVPNIPCPISIIVQIIDKKLNMSVTIRSQDSYLGLPSDVAGFSLLNLILAKELNVEPGIYSHFIANAHIYSNQYENINLLLERNSIQKPIIINIPNNSLERAKNGDDTLVNEIIDDIKNKYTPLEKLPLIQIIL